MQSEEEDGSEVSKDEQPVAVIQSQPDEAVAGNKSVGKESLT